MGQHIKTFLDNSFIKYDRGNFDDWCVYYISANGECTAPTDIDYFQELKNLAQKYGVEKVYSDFVSIYNITGKELEENILQYITNISSEYGKDSLKVDIIFSILYVAMISEEKIVYTKLGKRIKRLGVHLLLIDGESVDISANIMRGKKWYEIDADCRKRGF